jgi:hypothetical protein
MTEPEFQPQSGADVLKRVQPRLRIEHTQICMRPDLLDRHEELEDELAELERQAAKRPGRNADKPDEALAAKSREVQEVEAEILATQVRITFRALSKDRWQALTEHHPPRPGNNIDQLTGYNGPATVDAAVRLCIVDPVFEDCVDPDCTHTWEGEDGSVGGCGTWQHFVKVCNPSEWLELKERTQSVNRGVIDAPKSALAAAVLTSLAPAAELPEPGEQAPSDSTDGSPQRSTRDTPRTESLASP